MRKKVARTAMRSKQWQRSENSNEKKRASTAIKKLSEHNDKKAMTINKQRK